VNRSLGRKAATFGAAVATTAAGLVFLSPSAAQAASCVQVTPSNGGTRVSVVNNCSYLVDLRIHWSSGPDSPCQWMDNDHVYSVSATASGATYRYWIDCKGH
jgi:hypothetical protein